MFKNDIKVNYGTINILIYRLNQYKTALEDMKKAIHSIEKIFNKGKGEAMETFGIKSEELIKKMDGVEKEISDISGILKKYVTDMTAIIKPVSIDKMMRVDRNDIYWNMQTINGTCMGIPMIPMNVGVSSFGDWFDWDEDEEERERRRRNDDKLDEIKRMFCNTVNQVTDMADNLNRLYKKVQNYENMDDKYEKEAKKLKKEYTSFWEGARDFMNKMDEMKISYYKGFFNSVKEFIVGLVKLVGGTLKYAGSATLYLYGEVSGEDVPNWAKECYNDTNEMVLGVLKDPTILVEGLAQGVSDSFEEKGGAYCGGYAVGTVASAIVGTKGMDKLRGLAKGAGVAGKAEKVAAATEGVAEISEVVGESVGSKTGTVWDVIESTQVMREGTTIPKSFNISIEGQEFWVNPNGTKHMYEYITREAQHIGTFTTPVSSQSMLKEFESALSEAVRNNGLKVDEMIYGGDWEFIITSPRKEGLNYVVKHARYNPK